MPIILCPILSQLEKNLVERLYIFVVDERLVPIDSIESNTGTYLKELPKLLKNNIILLNCLDNGKFYCFKFKCFFFSQRYGY